MASYYTQIYVKVDSHDLIEKLCTMDVSDLGRGFYTAPALFETSGLDKICRDGESAITEQDLLELAARVVEIIKGHGTFLGATYGYNWDPCLQVCHYTGDELMTNVLTVPYYVVDQHVNMRDVDAWINFVEHDWVNHIPEPEEDYE